MLSKKRLEVTIVVVTRNRMNALKRCLKSLERSVYKVSGIIVVDNASDDKSIETVKNHFPKVKLILQKENTGAAEGRNIGAGVSKSELLYFLDDDAYIERNTIKSAVETIMTDENIAVVQSKVLSSTNPDKILGIAHDINTTTSLITAWGINEIDRGQYSKVMDIPMVGTGWLIRTEVFNLVKGFDKKFFIPYEDSDISLRIRQRGYRIVFDPGSQIYHDELKITDINPQIRSIGIASVERALYVGRNKIYFMRKHSNGLGRVVFFVILLPLFIVYHCAVILLSLRFDVLRIYLKGVILGFRL
ncbi:MAG: glycosyltransferase family 2 protein [Candidatus Levybacteria bacterium]|nr:glycosyltransferase family 2 protein [Candidatus Levybacteria bacterium]